MMGEPVKKINRFFPLLPPGCTRQPPELEFLRFACLYLNYFIFSAADLRCLEGFVFLHPASLMVFAFLHLSFVKFSYIE